MESFIRLFFCLPVLMCLHAHSAVRQITFEGEVLTSDISVGKDGIRYQDDHITFENYDISMDDGSMLIVDQNAPLTLSYSTLKIDGVQADILLQNEMQVGSSQIKVLNGAEASLTLQGGTCCINQGASLNVDGGSTLTLSFAQTSPGDRSVYRLVGETSLTPKAEINVTNHSHLVIRMDESWVETILQQLSGSTSKKSVQLATFATWNIDDTSSITLEGSFLDSRYGSLTVHGGVEPTYTNIGNGEIGLIWEESTAGAKSLSVRYAGPLNPYRAVDISTAGGTIADGTYDSLTGSTGTAAVLGKVVITESISLGEGAVVKLEGAGAAVSHGGITIGNKDSAGGAEIRGTGDARFTIADAVVRVDEGAPASLTLDAALSNVLLENNNSETTLSASVASRSLNGIQAAGGAINLEQSEPDRPLSLQSLVITDRGRVSVSGSPQPRLLKAAAALPAMEQESAEIVNVSDGTFDIEQLAAATALPMQAVLVADAGNLPLLGAASPAGILIEENGNAQFGSGAVLNAGLTLSPGAKLVFDDVLTMDGCLNLGTGMLLEGALLSGIDALEPGDRIVLIQGNGGGLRYMEDLNDNQANLYFSNIDAAFKIMANGSQFGLVKGIAVPTPEPSFGMLSLMAIATLAARRRRK